MEDPGLRWGIQGRWEKNLEISVLMYESSQKVAFGMFGSIWQHLSRNPKHRGLKWGGKNRDTGLRTKDNASIPGGLGYELKIPGSWIPQHSSEQSNYIYIYIHI